MVALSIKNSGTALSKNTRHLSTLLPVNSLLPRSLLTYIGDIYLPTLADKTPPTPPTQTVDNFENPGYLA